MPKLQLLADTEYFSFFSSYFETIEGIELVGIHPDILFDASFLHVPQKLAALAKIDMSDALIVTNILTVSATRVRSLVNNVHIAGMPIFPGYFERQTTVEFSSALGSTSSKTQAEDFLTLLGKKGEFIEDGIAGVFPRTLAMIINEAAFAIEESVATAADINMAMKLGTGYPKGPLEWCDEIGVNSVVAVLDALSAEYGADRYRPASLLRRYAEAGIAFSN